MARGRRSSYFDAAVLTRKIKYRVKPVLVLLSLFVVISVFWQLKLVGITLAGDAFCGIEEHQHSEECYVEESICELEEHVHVASCYSDITADLETAAVWEATFAELELDETSVEKMIAIATSQLGYAESERNFILDEEGNRQGYTRYGEWYGNPYGDWANMFTSFCLRYSGFDEKLTNSGADAMRLAWEERGLYLVASEYEPVSGDIVFLNKNENESVDTTAIVSVVSEDEITVIEGDGENQVVETTYEINDEAIVGYGIALAAEEMSLEEDIEGEETEEILMYAAAPVADMPVIGNTVTYNSNTLSGGGRFIIYTQASDGRYYAIDGNANAVEIQIDSNGVITSDIADPTLLYWTFTKHQNNFEGKPAYYIQNVKTGIYIHPYYTNNNDHGAVIAGNWETAIHTSGNGVKFQGARQNYYAILSGASFTETGTLNDASTFYFGKAPAACTVWLDGTQGNLMSLRGSPNESYSVVSGNKFTLPAEWAAPTKYDYELVGWYDVTNSKYYPAGAEVTVTDNMVFYAYWEARTYDIGKYNSYVSDTVSTNDFVTTKVFDYNFLFNVQSAYLGSDITVNESSHSERWRLMQSGNVPYKGQETLNYIFRDWDGTGQISYPDNTNNQNTYNSNIKVYDGLYSSKLGNILFGTDNDFDPTTGEGIIGKNYLGEGDHLFQFMTDPSDELYGYYYYDSARNAASYNQTDQRFYVYDYLERTTESANAGSDDDGKYSDFLPMNSPYANTNDKDIVTYTYDGINGEYAGVPHVTYDAKYNDGGSTTSHVGTNFGFGMSIDVKFYLPESPGTGGNQDVYGNDMHFHFSGDDDVWVLIDGNLVLDIGGIHGVESGDINFSTGIVTVNDAQTGTITNIAPGEHTLTIYYLERGSSQSNCAIYFNLAPRFSLSIEKEDVLTQEVLNGAQFSVYTDRECTKPAELWASEADYNEGLPSTNTFTISKGVANMWGFGAGQTYYIKETKHPDAPEYDLPKGIIKVAIDKQGTASYSVEMLEESNEISGGFTVHGFRIDEETQKAYIVATNAPKWVEETTSVMAKKKWNDNKDHTYDEVIVYLTVTDPDGTIRRIREEVLNAENDWSYVWTNLPKKLEDGSLVKYNVEEGYVPGYYGSIVTANGIESTKTTLQEAQSFEKGKTYLLKGPDGYLSTTSADASTFKWVNEKTAASSKLALWEVTDLNGDYRFKNGAGQYITYNYSSNWWQTSVYYDAEGQNGSDGNKRLIPESTGEQFRLYRSYNNNKYYIGELKEDGNLTATTDQNAGVAFTPVSVMTITNTMDGTTFEVTNTPLDEETSLKVTKEWDLGILENVGEVNSSLYEKEQVTVKLFADGKETGRSVTLNLKNGWTDTFKGLPYKDTDGNVITYTVEESWDTEDWIATYGDVITVVGNPPTYETTVTNVYRFGQGYELPATGRRGPGIWILCGLGTMIGSLVYGCVWRRKRERGYNN